MSTTTPPELHDIGPYKYGWSDPTHYTFEPKKGVSPDVVREISALKGEPEWMTKFRLRALEIFDRKPMPSWGGELGDIDFQDIYYYIRASEKQGRTWEEVPDDIKNTFDRLGIPEAERKFLAGVSAQYESEVVYHSIREDLEAQGVIFCDTDTALREHPDLFKEHWATVIPPGDNKFSALNSAVWSGGSFIWVPPGVRVEIPLQAYFRINQENMGQFERTLIICDEDSFVHYVEGCTAPVYSSDSLHSAVVEIIVKKGARCRYTTIQNWSTNVYNLVTKRAVCHENATMEWVDGNLGCLTSSAKVFTRDRGPVSIAEIREGDMVFGTDLTEMRPTARRVTATRENGVQEVFRITTENFRSVQATANHPFLVLDREPLDKAFTVRWRRLDNIRVGDYVAVARGVHDEVGDARFLGDYRYETAGRNRPQPVDLPLETTEELMWLLGLYIGDGFIERVAGRARRLNFAVPPGDRARDRLEKTLRSLFGVAGVQKGPNTLAINSSILADFVSWLGFTGGAREKRIPGWIYELPIAQRLAFIEGYLDADGHVRKAKVKDGIQYGQIVWSSANYALLDDLKLLLIACGLEPRKISGKNRVRKLELGTQEREYSNWFLAMNLRGSLDVIRRQAPAPAPVVQFVRVTSIIPVEPQPTYDIEIEGIENFVANGLVVHNSRLTMKYPAVWMVGKGARGEVLSVAFANEGMHQDAGAKMVHVAPDTSSTIVSKSVSKGGGRTSYRGLVRVEPGAKRVKASVVCDALLLDEDSRSDTYPYMDIQEEDTSIGHEATVSKVADDQIFYLMSRGLSEEAAMAMIVRGFIEPIAKELPMEYAVELNRLIELQMEGSIG